MTVWKHARLCDYKSTVTAWMIALQITWQCWLCGVMSWSWFDCEAQWLQAVYACQQVFFTHIRSGSCSLSLSSVLRQCVNASVGCCGYSLFSILFIIYINDLPDCLTDDSNIYLYADDAKLFRHISTSQDSLFLQDDINKLSIWTDECLIKLNKKI